MPAVDKVEQVNRAYETCLQCSRLEHHPQAELTLDIGDDDSWVVISAIEHHGDRSAHCPLCRSSRHYVRVLLGKDKCPKIGAYLP